jgi:hypothetical protein
MALPRGVTVSYPDREQLLMLNACMFQLNVLMTLGRMTVAIVATTMTEGEEVAMMITGAGAATMNAETATVIATAVMDVTMIVADGTRRGGIKCTC